MYSLNVWIIKEKVNNTGILCCAQELSRNMRSLSRSDDFELKNFHETVYYQKKQFVTYSLGCTSEGRGGKCNFKGGNEVLSCKTPIFFPSKKINLESIGSSLIFLLYKASHVTVILNKKNYPWAILYRSF